MIGKKVGIEMNDIKQIQSEISDLINAISNEFKNVDKEEWYEFKMLFKDNRDGTINIRSW